MKNWKKIKLDQKNIQGDGSSGENNLIQKILMREKVVDAIRLFFKNEGFHEVETPLLVQSPGTEPYLEVFEAELKTPNYKNKKSYLLTSPELAMKKLLASGIGNIFQITKSFRNGEGLSSFHNPEFSILEWYRTQADYLDVMKDCENLLLFILNKLALNEDGKNILTYQGIEYDLSTPWERISISEAFEKYAGVSIDDLLPSKNLLPELNPANESKKGFDQKLVAIAKTKGYQVDNQTTWEQAYNQILLNEIEPHLGKTKPTILYDYPVSQAALSKKKKSDSRFAERFEFFIGGIEMGNAFSELTDAKEQEQRMIDDLKLRKELGKVEYQIDQDFIEALKLGIPETGGIAVGVDRLVMLFADAETIKETLFFPIEDIFDY